MIERKLTTVQLIKFVDPYSSNPLLITPSDQGILTLLSTLSLLSLQIDSLTSQIESQQNLIREYGIKKQLGMMRNALMRRKGLEGLLGKRVESLGVLESVKGGIEKAVGDEAVRSLTLITSPLISSPLLCTLTRSQLIP